MDMEEQLPLLVVLGTCTFSANFWRTNALPQSAKPWSICGSDWLKDSYSLTLRPSLSYVESIFLWEVFIESWEVPSQVSTGVFALGLATVGQRRNSMVTIQTNWRETIGLWAGWGSFLGGLVMEVLETPRHWTTKLPLIPSEIISYRLSCVAFNWFGLDLLGWNLCSLEPVTITAMAQVHIRLEAKGFRFVFAAFVGHAKWATLDTDIPAMHGSILARCTATWPIRDVIRHDIPHLQSCLFVFVCTYFHYHWPRLTQYLQPSITT